MSSSPANDGRPPGPRPAGEPVKHPAPPSPWAADRNRGLLGPTTLALMIVAVIFLLVMIFPGENYTDPRYADQVDGVSVAYLRAILRARPHDPNLRLVLARQQLTLGQLGDALRTLEPLLTTGPPRNPEAELLALDVELHKMFSDGMGPREREAWRRRARDRFGRLSAGGLGTEPLTHLAELGLQLGEPAMAARVYLRLGRFGGIRHADMLELAGRWFLAAGERRDAARAFREAALAARGQPRAVALGQRAVDALIGARLPAEALALIQELLPVLGRPASLLEQGTSLAGMLGKGKLALTFAAERAAASPRDLTQQRRWLSLQLALGPAADAMRTASEVVALAPDDPAERRRHATIARWSGDPAGAMADYLWLARRGFPDGTSEGLAIARPLYDWPALRELLEIKAARQGLAADEVDELARVYEALGEPEAAIETLARRGDRADRHVWERLAALYHGSRRTAEELATRREITRRFGRRLDELVAQARLAAALGSPEDMLAILEEARDLAGPDEIAYWRLYGDLAYRREATASAIIAYRQLWRSGRADREETRRLLALYAASGRREELMALTRAVWARHPDAAWLLLPMQNAADARRWDEVEALVALADAQPALFAASEQYWLLRAALMSVRNRPSEVEESYRRALVANPLSRDARLAWIYFALDHDLRPRLAQLVTGWWSVAAGDPGYARTWATALDRLGRLDAALPFYDREARAHPDDLEWLALYAGALDRAGRPDEAGRLRAVVLRGRAAHARKLLAAWARAEEKGACGQASCLPAEGLIAYARLLRLVRGPEAAAPVNRLLFAVAPDNRAVQALAIDTELERANLPEARRWMARIRDGGLPSTAERVALAQAEGDRRALAALVTEHPQELPIADRISVERQLGRDDVARKLLAEATLGAEAPGLSAQARELALAGARRMEVTAGYETLGPLDLVTERAGYQAPLGGGWLRMTAGHVRLAAGDTTILIGPPESRGDLALEAGVATRRLGGTLGVGAEASAEALRPRVEAEGVVQLPELVVGSRVRVFGAEGAIPQDSAVLRLYGRRDRVGAEAHLAVTRYEYLRLGLQQHEDHTLAGERLAMGPSAVLEAGHHLSLGNPALRAFVQGAWARNGRPAVLPASVAAALAEGANADVVIPHTFTSLAAGLALGQGDLRGLPATSGAFSYALSAVTGWLLPSGQLSLRLEAGFAVRVVADQNIGVQTFFSRSQDGRVGETARGAQIRYVIGWN